MSKSKKKNYEVPTPKLPDENIQFSFRFYDTSSKEFCISRWGEEKIFASLKALQDINRKTYSELLGGKTVYHFHPVPWEQTDKKNGFPNANVNALDAFQFALIGVNGQKARVFGALARNTFYIVWFDLEHKIYPTWKKNT